jgi:hypothetical protein
MAKGINRRVTLAVTPAHIYRLHDLPVRLRHP